MTNPWPLVRLQDIFDLCKGKIGIKAATPGAYPLVTTAENHASHSEAHFTGDAICIPMVSATGHGHASIRRIHHIRGQFAAGSILCVCINQQPDQVDARFIHYFLNACKETVLIPLMQGSANVSLKLSDIADVRVPLPPLNEQHATVAQLDSLSEKNKQIEAYLTSIESDAEKLLAIQFRQLITEAPYQPIGDVAPVIKRNVEIDLEKKYREVGARSFGKGLFIKPDFDGAEATWQKPVWIEEGDLVLSNIKAWEGAIAVAGSEHHRCIASHRYITCVPRQDLATARFLNYYLLSREGMDQVSLASPGTADRNRTLSLGSLAKIKVPVPPLKAQIRFNALQAKVGELKARHNVIREANAALVPAMLERIFESGRGDKLHK